jgi:hypothetical protein
MTENCSVFLLLRAATAVALAVATAVVALAQLALPNRAFWQGQLAVVAQWVSVSAMAAFILVTEVRTISALIRSKACHAYDLDLRAVLSATLCGVVELTGTPWDELSVCYYRPKGLPWDRRLVRTASVMLGAGGADAPVSVGTGEGLVGAAFTRRMILAEDWGEFVRTATDEGPAEWEARNPDLRYGLKWGQLRRSANSKGMLASPTFRMDGAPDGCILLSGTLKLSDLTTYEMRRILEDLATALDRVGPPPRGWWSYRER